METKQLGHTSVMVPEIGIGVWRYRGGIEPLRKAIELGAGLIYTAEVYGTEEVVGQAIKGMRERVLIATKVSGAHLRHDDIARAAEASLRRLECGFIDLYQIHWPNPAIPITETMGALELLADRKLIRHIGVSNFSLAELREAQAAMRHHQIVSNQVLYSLNRREIEDDLLPYCVENRITIIAYTPLDDGRLAALPRFRTSRRMQALAKIAKETGKTPAQVALNWCTSRPNVIAIPKSNRTRRVIENCEASGWRLTPQQIQFLDSAFA